MIWWRGRGFWIPLIIAVPVLSATSTHASPIKLAMAFMTAALLIQLLRGWLGEKASVYSISARTWPLLLIGMAVLTMAVGLGESRRPRGVAASAGHSPSASLVAAPTATATSPGAPAATSDSGVAAFESWARQDLAAADIRYRSNDEIWISLQRKPDHPDAAAQEAAARYKQYMARTTPIKLVLFADNTRVAEATQ